MASISSAAKRPNLLRSPPEASQRPVPVQAQPVGRPPLEQLAASLQGLPELALAGNTLAQHEELEAHEEAGRRRQHGPDPHDFAPHLHLFRFSWKAKFKGNQVMGRKGDGGLYSHAQGA